MKLFALLAAVFCVAQANAAQPDFICQDENGMKYEFYMSSYSEIQIYDQNGNFDNMIDGIYFQTLSLESFPPVDQHSVYDGETDELLGSVSFRGNNAKGAGNLEGYSNQLTCTR